jgi:hypothetical protein
MRALLGQRPLRIDKVNAVAFPATLWRFCQSPQCHLRYRPQCFGTSPTASPSSRGSFAPTFLGHTDASRWGLLGTNRPSALASAFSNHRVFPKLSHLAFPKTANLPCPAVTPLITKIFRFFDHADEGLGGRTSDGSWAVSALKGVEASEQSRKAVALPLAVWVSVQGTCRKIEW